MKDVYFRQEDAVSYSNGDELREGASSILKEDNINNKSKEDIIDAYLRVETDENGENLVIPIYGNLREREGEKKSTTITTNSLSLNVDNVLGVESSTTDLSKKTT